MNKNILLTSVGRRNVVVKYFKKSMQKNGGTVFVADCNPCAPALYETKHAFIVPKIKDPRYIPTLLSLCKKYNIHAIISLIDTELPLLAQNKELFAANGITCIVSDIKGVETCFDKFALHQFLQQESMKSIPTFLTLEETLRALKDKKIQFPLIMKPRTGSASIGIVKIENEEQLRIQSKKGTIIQQFIEGEEFGIDVYVDFVSKEVISVFPKKKIAMRAGETDKAVSTNNSEAVKLATSLVKKLHLLGPLDIDCFKTEDGFITAEINPRFGGGFPLAYECGIDTPKMIIENINGRSNQKVQSFSINRYMFKYDNVCIKNHEDLQHE